MADDTHIEQGIQVWRERAEALSKPQVDLSKYINAADISAGDAPHIVIEKLQRVINGSAPLIEERSTALPKPTEKVSGKPAGVDHPMDMSLITELSRDPSKPSFSKPQVRISEEAVILATKICRNGGKFKDAFVGATAAILLARELLRLSEELK